MKIKSTFLMGLATFGLFAIQGQAATISWGAPQNITDDTDVLAPAGYAYEWGVNAGGAAVTVNSLSFDPQNDAILDGNTHGDFQPDATDPTISAEYMSLLDPGRWNLNTVTLSGLAAGTQYAVKLWSSDSRGCCGVGDDRKSIIDGAVTLDESIGNAAGNLGQFAVGTFIADAAAQTISISSNVNVQHRLINAVALYSVPEPGSLLLATLGGLAFVRRRRR
jgi:hypothetical protein